MHAQLAHQALAEYAQQRGRQQEGLDAHVGQAGDGAGRVIGVQRGEHQVTRQRGLHGDLRGLEVADFTDHDDVRILAQDGAQGLGKGQLDLGIDLGLADARQFVLDRVFDGQHIGGGGVHCAQARVQRGGLARAGGAGDQHDAVGLAQQPLELVERLAAHAQRLQRELAGVALVQDPQHGALAMRRGQRRDPHVHRAATDAQADAAVLRQALFGDVELGHDLQARDQRGVQRLVGLHHLAQRAVHPKAHGRRALVGLDVDVRRAVLGRLRQQRIEHADDGRVVARFEQVFDGGQLLQHARQVDRAFDLTDHSRCTALAARVGRRDALRQGVGRIVLDAVDSVQAQHLGQGRVRDVQAGPQRGALAILLQQQVVGLGKGVRKGVACAHGVRAPWLKAPQAGPAAPRCRAWARAPGPAWPHSPCRRASGRW